MNVRKVVSQQTWKDLRSKFNLDDGKCSICQCRDRGESLHLHEVWECDDASKVQKLKSLVPLCQACHEVKHIGRTMKLGDGFAAMRHFQEINGWCESEALRYIERATREWGARSNHEWRIDLSYLTKFVPETRIHSNWLSRTDNRPSNPLEARIWATEALESDALILDTETTGLPNKHLRSEIIEIAIMTATGETKFDSLVRPKYRIPKRTIRINGITNDDVSDAPMFPEVFSEIRDILHGQRVIAYKSEFDQAMLKKTCEMHGLEPPDCDWDCAMWAYYFYSGATTGRFTGLPHGDHRASGDCRAIISLLHQMSKGEGDYYGRIDFSKFGF